nr:RNA-directed DNA polymerase, eukaryota [Tanacetum cinerariifolium]
MLLTRMELSRKLYDIKQLESADFVQKSKVKWAIEGDENSKFFHGLINKKRSQLSIREIFANGDWLTDPKAVEVLDSGVTRAEIREAVWGCGVNKSPGFFDDGFFPNGNKASFITLIPKVIEAKFVTDFRPINLIGSVYKVVTKIIANRLATVISGLVSDSQSAFIVNRQILDGPFILNEVLAWCKRKKKQALIFKDDFAKAYDSVRWNFLLDVLQAFGFGPDWCKWIRGIFTSAMASVLINGSPTFEFPFFCGLKQGDPLAPFLFILVMESLHISVSKSSNEGVYKGLQLHESVAISHLFYADDVVFIGEWSEGNLENLVRILNCFYFASGLKINLQKSHVLGIGIPYEDVRHGASLIGCDVMRTPFKYLGVTVGDFMSRNSTWVNVIQKIQSRLSKWKSKTPFSWRSFDSCKISFSLFALNRALLLKWVWRFLSNDGSLWSQVIKAIYGSSFGTHSVKYSSTWCSILREVQVLWGKGFDFVSHVKKRVGNGQNTKFWLDTWILDSPLSVKFPRLVALDSNKQVSVTSKWAASGFNASFRREIRDGVERQQWTDMLSILGTVILSPSFDRWICDLNGDGTFRVKDIRAILDDMFLPSASEATRWVKYIPIKINVFNWRARLDRLPTRCNLLNRCVVLESSLCPICGSVPEDAQHIFFSASWPNLCFFGSVVGGISIGLSSKLKLMLEGVFDVAWWHIWSFRNQTIFNDVTPRRDVLLDDIISRSFMWVQIIASRNLVPSDPYVVSYESIVEIQ